LVLSGPFSDSQQASDALIYIGGNDFSERIEGMILKKLKESTKIQHEQLEKLVNLVDDGLSREEYIATLVAFYRFYQSLEPKLERFDFSPFGYDFFKRRRLPLLENDLQALGFSELRDIPIWSGLPNLETIAEGFGCLYVVEGSSLGGQVILRHLRSKLNLDESNGASFFNIYGPQTGEMWKDFGNSINKFMTSTEADEKRIILGAIETFEGFSRCFLSSPKGFSYDVME
jgi:heme oxygenase